MITLFPRFALALGAATTICCLFANASASEVCCVPTNAVYVSEPVVISETSSAPSWVFRRSTFTNDPVTGARVAQYMRKPPVEPLADQRNVTSVYRRTRTVNRGPDGSMDTSYQVQAWGNGRGGIDAEWQMFNDVWKESILSGSYYNSNQSYGPWRPNRQWYGNGGPSWGNPGWGGQGWGQGGPAWGGGGPGWGNGPPGGWPGGPNGGWNPGNAPHGGGNGPQGPWPHEGGQGPPQQQAD